MSLKTVFTRRFAILVAIEVIGFVGAIALLFTDIPFAVPTFICTVTLGIGIWGALDAAEGRL